MSDLRLPFWVLFDRDAQAPPSAFSTTEKLTAFLDTDASGRWKTSLIAHPEALLFAIADAHQQGVTALLLDPELGATPGDSVRLVDLMELNARMNVV
jgi:hypothetical protein